MVVGVVEDVSNTVTTGGMAKLGGWRTGVLLGKNGFARVMVAKKLLTINPCSPSAQFRHAPGCDCTSCLGRVAVHPGRVALPVTLNRRADVCFLVISFIVIS